METATEQPTRTEAAAIMETIMASASPARTIDHDAVAREFIAAARRTAAKERFFSQCPPAMLETDWSRAALMPYSEAIRRVLGHSASNRGLVCAGPTGRGKTRAMWQLMRRFAIDEGRDVRCWSASDWFTTLGSFLNFGRDDAAGWVKSVASRTIVFIDDLGQEAISTSRQDWAMGWFFQFLDQRVNLGLPLYLTTNLRADELAAPSARGSRSRGDPLVRRILELCETVKFYKEGEQ